MKLPIKMQKKGRGVCDILKENVFPYTLVGAEEDKSSYISECCHVPDPQTEGEIPVVESRLWSQVVAGPQEDASRLYAQVRGNTNTDSKHSGCLRRRSGNSEKVRILLDFPGGGDSSTGCFSL